jgi:hypothetical protein
MDCPMGTTAIHLMLGLRRPTPGRVRLLSHEPEAVLRALFGRGLEISDLEVTGASLEEAVVSLTAGRGGGDGAVATPAAETRA